ncbi:MAG: NADH-quinone oxidoreductase subunit H [Candidatus Omnitrophica bacterium]|nr:NADH-quinone oxidoreductase subunit H [Candidatus Omnitrophota bacterium]
MKFPAYMFAFLVFPGFVFSAVAGLMAGWVDRKVTARLQWRVGPPWYQNFFDILKLLLYKETLIPRGVPKAVFLGMPALGLAAATLVSTIVLITSGMPKIGFIGDVIVVVYLMLIPPITLMLGGFASANSLASLGASREMKLMLSYELPFILALAVPIMKCGYVIRLGDIIAYQRLHGDIFASLSGGISFFVMLLCIQAKLGFVPFDMPEAETELMGGPYIEYSGKALAIFKLTKAVMTVAIPAFMIALYLGGIKLTLDGIVKAVIKYILILTAMIIIKNTNPRVRIDQAVKFFWGIVMVLAAVSLVLAFMGR